MFSISNFDLNWLVIECVQEFQYLGSIIDKSGGTLKDVETTIRKPLSLPNPTNILDLWQRSESTDINIKNRGKKYGWIGHTLRKTSAIIFKNLEEDAQKTVIQQSTISQA